MNPFSFLSSPTVLALGYTLVYSLWQAFIVYIFLRLILKYISGSFAKFRYAISSFAFLGIAVWFVITFLQQLSLRQTEYISKEITGHSSLQQIVSNHYFAAASDGFSFAFLNNYLPWLVAVYLTGIICFGFRLMLDYFQTIRLRTEELSDMEPAFMDYIWELANKMGIKKPVYSYISCKIEIPVMIGFFRPFILLPLAAINNLSPQQIEAILLHELAHIRRNDYLWNLVQTVLDIIFFFNPFAWWISKNIRNEREQCCDEMVLQFSDPYHYARALLSLEESDKQSHNLVMAAVRKHSQLLHRIKNIMEMKNHRINLRQKLIALVIVITATISIAWLTPKENKTMDKDTKLQNSKASLSFAQIIIAPNILPGHSKLVKLVSDSSHPGKVPPPPPLPPAPPITQAPPAPPLPPVPPIAPHVSMNALKDSFPSSENYFKGPEWKKQMEAINKSADSIQKYFHSKAWQQQQKEIQNSTAGIQKYFNSPEWKKNQEEIKKNAEKMQQYFNSDAWKKNQEEIKKNAEKMQQYFNSDEWKKQNEELKHVTDSVKAYFKSDEWKKQQENLQEAITQTNNFFQSDEWKKQKENLKKLMENVKEMQSDSQSKKK